MGGDAVVEAGGNLPGGGKVDGGGGVGRGWGVRVIDGKKRKNPGPGHQYRIQVSNLSH